MEGDKNAERICKIMRAECTQMEKNVPMNYDT